MSASTLRDIADVITAINVAFNNCEDGFVSDYLILAEQNAWKAVRQIAYGQLSFDPSETFQLNNGED